MTLHIHYDHDCPECGVSYIPYDLDVPCPNCGRMEEERFETFVDEAAESALFNFDTGGSFMPAAWMCFGLADEILMFIFELFTEYWEGDHDDLPEEFISRYIAKCEFEGCEYMRDYLAKLALKIMQSPHLSDRMIPIAVVCMDDAELEKWKLEIAEGEWQGEQTSTPPTQGIAD